MMSGTRTTHHRLVGKAFSIDTLALLLVKALPSIDTPLEYVSQAAKTAGMGLLFTHADCAKAEVVTLGDCWNRGLLR